MSPALSYLTYQPPLTWSITRSYCRGYITGTIIKGVVLKSLESYLTACQQGVIIDGELSEPALLKQGISLMSVHGPTLFTLYNAPLGNHGIPYMMYADDQQLYVAFKATSQVYNVKHMESISTCVTDIQHWMNVNYCKCNGEN